MQQTARSTFMKNNFEFDESLCRCKKAILQAQWRNTPNELIPRKCKKLNGREVEKYS